MVRLQQVIDLVRDILQACQREKRGRPAKSQPGAPATYPRAHIVLILLLKTLKGWSINHTHKKLTDDIDSTWREMLDLNREQIPTRRWLNELEHHSAVRALRQRVYRRLRRRLLDEVALDTLAVDLTAIEVVPEWDSLTVWGHTSTEEAFYGYKLHLLCTVDGLPLAIRVTRADGHELNEVGLLFKEAQRLLGQQTEEVEYILGDAAYDANDTYDDARTHLEAQFQADVNPRNAQVSEEELQMMSAEVIQRLAKHPSRQQGLQVRYGEAGRARHQQRSIVEELFGILKELMPGFTDLKWYQAGIRRVREHFRWLMCAFIAILARNQQHGESFLGIKMVLA